MDNRERQQLIDLVFEVAIVFGTYPQFSGMSREDVADYCARQLRALGYVTKPVGMSWGVLESGTKS